MPAAGQTADSIAILADVSGLAGCQPAGTRPWALVVPACIAPSVQRTAEFER